MTTSHSSPPDNAGPERDQNGRFRPGISGNPGGGRRGSRHRVARAFDQVGEADAQAVIDQVVSRARGGDMQAAALLLPRIWPVRKGKPVRLKLPEISCTADILDAHAALVRAVAEGIITPDEAHAIGAVLEGMLRAVEAADLEDRIVALEEAAAAR